MEPRASPRRSRRSRPKTNFAAELVDFEARAMRLFHAAFLERLGVASLDPSIDATTVWRCICFLQTSRIGYDQFFFDWYGGAPSEVRAKASPNADAYAGAGWDAVRRDLERHSPTHPERLADPYFARKVPCSLLMDEIEAIWKPIAARDDWSAFEAKVADIRELAKIARSRARARLRSVPEMSETRRFLTFSSPGETVYIDMRSFLRTPLAVAGTAVSFVALEACIPDVIPSETGGGGAASSSTTSTTTTSRAAPAARAAMAPAVEPAAEPVGSVEREAARAARAARPSASPRTRNLAPRTFRASARRARRRASTGTGASARGRAKLEDCTTLDDENCDGEPSCTGEATSAFVVGTTGSFGTESFAIGPTTTCAGSAT